MLRTPVDFHLDGKVAIVTGASRGIGHAIASGFAEAGASVVIVSRNLADLEKAAGAMVRRPLVIAADISRLEDIRNLVAQTMSLSGRIDILVNNAGMNFGKVPALDIEERDWDNIMNLNLKGLFFLSQAVAKTMKTTGGCIINIASGAGIRPSTSVYSISKAGVIMATKVLAREWARYGIRVNALAPGIVKTKMTEHMLNDTDRLKSVLARIPMRRFAEATELVGSAIYLASDASSYVTGETITVDGGISI